MRTTTRLTSSPTRSTSTTSRRRCSARAPTSRCAQSSSLAAARDATAEVAEALTDQGAEAIEPLLPEWRGALFRVRLARLRLATPVARKETLGELRIEHDRLRAALPCDVREPRPLLADADRHRDGTEPLKCEEHEHELGPLLKEAEAGGVTILWVLVGHCNWKSTPLKNYQAASATDKPLAAMKTAERDRAWVAICEAILAAANPR